MTDTPWLQPDEMRAWRGWVRMSEMLRARLNRDLVNDSGMSDADYAVLVWLSEAPGHILRMSDLANGLGWSKSRASHQVARMATRGLVARQTCPADARGAFAVMTDAGQREITRAAPLHLRSVRQHLIDHLPPADLAALASITERVIAHLEATAPAVGEPDSDPCAVALPAASTDGG